MAGNIGQTIPATSTTIAVSGSVNQAFPQAGATQVAKCATGQTGQVGNGTTLLYTPTAGKTFYISTLTMSTQFSVAGSSTTVSFLDNATAFHTNVLTTNYAAGVWGDTVTLTFPVPVPITNTLKVTVAMIGGGTVNVVWSAQGFEA